MSTSAIAPIAAIDFDSSSATASQQSVFNNLLNQLEQAIGSGNLNNTATLLNAVNALSPSAAGSSTPLGTFLTSVSAALGDGSVTEAQSALATFQNAAPASTAAAPSTTATSATAASIAAGLIQGQIQLNLVTSLLSSAAGSANSNNPDSSSSSSSANSLIGLLNAAYPAEGSSSSGSSGAASSAPAATSTTPYDTLISSIQTSLAGGNGTITPALAYLQASGNFVNTSV
ncbi:MAG TPA: hypothetical protein VHZ52_16335 [Acidobacteriaceae bacterium]|jgi:hypothetical protein|nr:hypothetical protein [Acidobacteriaceae bacterium]